MNLTFELQLQRPQIEIDLQLNLTTQGIYGITGPSGSGKTTLLRSLAGLDRHPNTKLLFAGEVWQDGTEFLNPRKRGVGYVSQHETLFPHLTVAQNIHYAAKRRHKAQQGKALQPEDHSLVTQLVQQLGLDSLAGSYPHQLSGGQKQRTAIARALASQPRLLLLDEPLSSLDHTSKQEILPYLQELQKHQKTDIIYVSHSPEELELLTQQLILIENGKVKAVGTTEELLTSSTTLTDKALGVTFPVTPRR